MNENEKLYDDSEMTELDSQPKVQKIQGVDTINKVNTVSTETPLSLGTSYQAEPKATTSTRTYASAQAEDDAKQQAELDIATGVQHVLDDIDLDDYVSTKDLYEKTLGITEYDELRAKLHLADNESFTDYYNRTGYIPEGFEIQAKMLLAEEKRKRLYAEVQAGNMSEEDFLYETYGKDLLKEQGIDFSSSLYWYQKYKSKDFSDPRDNDTFMLQLISDARELFTHELWYEACAKKTVEDIGKYVTGEVLPVDAVYDLFEDQLSQLTEYFESREQVIKYYRAGLLQGFNPTIDTDGDGKVDYYYSTDGKLYNVNETGKGANTMKAYYKGVDDNGNPILHRIVASDSLAGEMLSEGTKGFLGFFTDVIDFAGMVGGLVVDFGQGIAGKGWDLSATTEVTATMGQFWNSTWLGDHDYVAQTGWKSKDGSINGANIARQGARLAGTILGFVATMGISSAVSTASAGGKATVSAAKEAGEAAMTKAAKEGAKKAAQKAAYRSAYKASVKASQQATKKALIDAGKNTVMRKVGRGIGKVAMSGLNTAMKLTGWSNGVGVGSGTWGAMFGNAAITSMKDAINGAVNLTINREYMYKEGVTDHLLTDGEILGKAMGVFTTEFIVASALRSAVGTQALDRWAGIGKGVKDKAITGLPSFLNYSPQLLKVTAQSAGQRVAIGITNMAMDGVENIISAWIQTSYSTKGEVLDWGSLGRTLDSPSLWMNLGWQTLSNYKDNFSISGNEIAAASLRANEVNADMKNYLSSMAAANMDNAEALSAIKQLMTTYDDLVIKYTEETGSQATGILKAFEEVSTKAGLYDSTVPASYKQGETWKNYTDEQIKAINPVDKAAQRAFDLHTKMNVEYTAAMFEYINNIQNKWLQVNNNIFKKAGFRILYGADAKNPTVKLMENFRQVYAKDPANMEWEAAIANSFAKTDLFVKLNEELGDEGSDVFKALNDPQLTMGVMVKDESTGKWKLTGSLAEQLKDTPEEQQKYLAYAQDKIDNGQANQLASEIYILARNTGTSEDSNQNRIDGMKYLDIITNLLDTVSPKESGNDVIEKFGDAYVIKFNSMGDQVMNVEMVKGMIQTLAAIKISAIDSSVLSSNKSSKLMHLLLSYLTESKSDADKIFDTEDGAIMSAQVINLMLQKKLINYSEASRFIENLNAYIAEKNSSNTAAPKELPSLDKGQLSSESKLKGITGSIDLSEYKTALTIKDAIIKVEEAQAALIKLRAGGKQTQSDTTAIDNCSTLLKNSTIENILLKEHIITPKFKDTLNPFMQGQTDKVSKISLQKSAQTSKIYSEEEKTNLKKDLINSLYSSLGVDNDIIKNNTETISLRLNKESNKFVTLDIPLANITKGKSFAKFVSTYIGSEAFKELKKAGLDLYKVNNLNTLDSLNKVLDDSIQNASNPDLISSTRKKLIEGYSRYKHEITKSLINKYPEANINVLYKDISDKSGLSIDTIHRIINSKSSLKNEERIIRDRILNSYNTNDIVSHISKYSKDTEATRIKESIDAKFDIIFKDSVEIKTDGTIILRLNELDSSTLAASLHKLENPYTQSRIQEKDMDRTAIAKEIVGLNNLAKFNLEENELNYLKSTFGNELVVTEEEAKTILGNLGYSFTGNLKYTPNNSISGVYYNHNQRGYKIGDAKVLMSIRDAVSNPKKSKTHSRVLIKDPQSTADALMPLNIKPLSEPPASTDITLKPIDIEGCTIYGERYLQKVKSNNKIGKAASLTADAVAEYEAPVVGSKYNEDHRLYLTMHNLINALDEYMAVKKADGSIKIKDTESKSPVEILISKQSNKTAKDIKLEYGDLYDVNIDDTDPNLFKVIVSTKPYKQGEFAQKAFDLIASEGLTYDTIKKILPNNINYSKQGNPINAIGLDSTSLSGAQTPIAFAYNWLNKNNLDPNYITTIINTKGITTPVSISNIDYDNYIALVKGLSQQEILNLTENNIFLKMKQDEIRNDIKVQEITNNKILSLYKDEGEVVVNNIAILLTSEDMRRNISNALYKILPDTNKYFDEDGCLKITKELLDTIRNTITLTTTDGIDYSSVIADDTALSAYLSLLSLYTIKKITTDISADTLEEKLYSMIRAATMTGSEEAFISIKDLTRLSDEELDQLNDILIKHGAKKLDQKIIDTIKELEFRETKVSPEPIEYIVEQAETIQNTHSTSHGYIKTKEDYNLREFKLDNEALKSMIRRQKKNLNGDLFVKLSVINQDTYKQDALMNALLNRTRSKTGLLNYVNYPGSIIKTNFNYNLAKYNFLNSLTDFAIQLKEMDGFSHLNNETLMEIALEVYDRTTGTEFQAVHPDYIIVDKHGEIVDTVESNYSGVFRGEQDPLRNLLGSLLKQEDTSGMQIIRLHRNSLNNLYGYSTEPIEVYSVDRNRHAIIRMIQQRQESIIKRDNLKSNNRDLIIQRTAEYFAQGEMATPKFYTDQLYKLAESIGIGSEAIQDLITSEEALSSLSNRRTLHEESINTLFNGTYQDEQTNYHLQQLRDIQSYGETQTSFHNHEGVADALEESRFNIKQSLTLFDANESAFNKIVEAFKDGDIEKVSVYSNNFLKSLPEDKKDTGVTELLKYFISEQDTIASELYLLSKNTIEEILKESSKEFSDIKIQRYDSKSKKSIDSSTRSLNYINTNSKLIIDLEQFYNEETGEEHIFQIAYKYIDRMGIPTPGVIYLPKDNFSEQDYRNKYSSYFKAYETEEGAMNAVKALLDPNTKSNTLHELSKIIELAKQDGALLVGYNSNSFDIPKLINSDNPEIQKVFKNITDMDCLDIFELAKRLPTTQNIDSFNGKLRLSELGNYLGFKIEGAHNAQADIQLTESIMTKLLNSAIKQDTHHNKFSKDIREFYSAIAKKDIETTSDYKLSIGTEPETEVSNFVNTINKYKNKSSKFYDFTQIKNQIQERALSNYANIRRKEIEKFLNTHNAGYDIKFAETMSNPVTRAETLDLIGFALANVTSASNQTDSIEGRMPNVIKILNTYLHKTYSTKQDLTTLLADTDNLKTAILNGVNKSEEDFNTYRTSERENYMEELSNTYTLTAKDIQIDDNAYYVHRSIQPLDNLVNKYLIDGITNDTIKNTVKKRYNDALLRFYDAAGTKGGRIKKKRYEANNVINFYSNIHEDVLNYLKQSPVISRTFDSIYEIAQTTSNEVKLANGTKTLLKNDTIYLNAKTLGNLIGESNIDLESLIELYGDTNGSIWLPVIRHPRDMADNLHFLKLELIDDSEPYNMLLNIDTMKSKFNGDFDGDHISIVKPSKSLSKYAAAINPFKNAAYAILDEVMSKIPHTLYTEEMPILRSNKTIKKILNTHLTLLTEYEGDIISKYNSLKESFVNNPYNIKLFTDQGYTEQQATAYLSDIYLKEPIEIKATAGSPGFITYTDWEGMVYDSDNIKNKKIFRNNSLAYALNIAKLDSASGQAQKAKLLQDYKERFKDSLILEDTAITFSRSTSRIIQDNIDTVKKELSTIVNLNPMAKAIIQNAETSTDIETALRIHQMYQQDFMIKADTFKQALIDLKSSDDSFVKAFTRFSKMDNPAEFESNLSEFIYTIDDLEKINPYKGRTITSRDQDNIGKLVDYSRQLTSKGVLRTKDKKSKELLSNMATTVPCVYRLPGKGTGINAMNEDTFMMFNGMNNYTALLPTVKKIDDKNAQRLISKYFGDNILSNKVITNKKDLDLFGIKNTENCEIKMGYKTEDNIFVLYRSYSLDTVKTMSRGGKHTKGTPSGNVDLTEFPDSLRDTFNNCAVYRDLSFAKSSDINSHFKSYDYTCYDINGNKLDIVNGIIPKDTVWIMTQEDLSVMETTPLWSKASKESTDTLAGNSLFDTGGIAQTLGMFMNFDENNNLVFDDQGHNEMMRRIAKLNNPDLISKNASELYDLLRFAVLSKQLKQEDIPNSYNSVEEYIDHVMRSSDVRSVVELLKHKVNKSEFKQDTEEDKIIYTLLFDTELENRVRPLTPDTANTSNEVRAKGAARRMTAARSKFASESTGGGSLEKEFDIFNNIPSMSVIELINYITKSYGSSKRIYESNLIPLMEKGLLPVGYFNSEKGDQENISINNNKIGESVGDVTTRYIGNHLIPTDELGRDLIEEYDRYNADTNYYSNANSIRNRKYIDKESANLAVLLKSIYGDDKLNKYTILDTISPYSKSARVSYDPATYQFSDAENTSGLLQVVPKRYIETADTLKSISMNDAIDKLYAMRSSPLYYDTMNKTVENFKDNSSKILDSNLSISDDIITNMESRQKLPDHIADSLGLIRPQDLSDTDLGLGRPKLSEDTQANLARYKKVIYTSQELDEELKRNNLILGDKVVGTRKVFEAETIKLNNGIKIKDADDLIQDRNYKQTVVDCINNQNDLSQDVIKLYNYTVNKNTLNEVNTYTYLQAMRSKIMSLDDLISKTKDAAKISKFEADRMSFMEELKQFGIKDTVDLKAKVDEIKKNNPTEIFYADKIITNLNIESRKYSNLTNEPSSNLFYLLTNATSTHNKQRKANKNFILRLFGNKEQDLIQEKNDIPLYNSYDFMASINSTIKQIAKSKAIYENSIRLKKSGVLDNTKVQDTLIETINTYQKAIVDAKDDKGYYREGLKVAFKVIDSKLSSYMDESLLARFQEIDGMINNKEVKIGQLYLDTFKLLSEIAKNTGLTYETVRLDTTNIADAEKFIFCQEMTQDMFASMSALTNDKLVMTLADNLSRYANNNGLTIVDKFGRKKDISKIYMLHEGSLEFAQTLQDYENEMTFAAGLARDLINGELYLMDKNLANMYATGLFKEYKKPGKIKSILQKTSRLATTLLMSSPFKILDRFLKFSAFDATTLGTANIATFKYEGEAFKDLKAYFMSKGAASSKNLTEFLQTQGINMENSNFDTVLNMDPNSSPNLFKSYTDKVGNIFTFQTLSQRYAYWLATKASLEKGDYSTLGSAFHLKDAIMQLGDVVDSEGNVKVTRYGNQAAFAMAQMLGSPNDFPGASKTLNEYGFVFTTFPLAAARWGVGEFRSLSSAVKGLFTEGLTSQNAKWLFRQSTGLIGTFVAEQILVALICDMFGVTNEEDEEKWKKVGALPNITQSITQGQPIMDTFSSMNIFREVYDMTISPFVSDDSGDNVSGMSRFLYKNIIGHANPIAKNIYEVAAKKDIIDDQIIDTSNKYSGFENLFRKMSSYVLGASGANALSKSLTNCDGDYITGFTQGLKNAVQAEMGNTKAQKENIKNYYNMLSLINNYIDYSNSKIISNNGDFNYAQYQKVKSVIYSLINNRASSTEIYSAINDLTKQGYTLYEIRSALKNCSIGEKLNSITNYNEFLSSLTPAERQNLKTALEYEEFMYPWLEDNVRSITSYINKSNDTYNLSVPYKAYNTYRPSSYTHYSYYKPSYNNSYTNSLYNSRNNTYDPYDIYWDMVNDQAYQKQQAEYARKRKQWEDN